MSFNVTAVKVSLSPREIVWSATFTLKDSSTSEQKDIILAADIPEGETDASPLATAALRAADPNDPESWRVALRHDVQRVEAWLEGVPAPLRTAKIHEPEVWRDALAQKADVATNVAADVTSADLMITG